MDDGAESFEESVAMLNMAAQAGTTDLVATPHANLGYSYQPELIEQRLEALRDACAAPRLHRGCDFHLSYDNVLDALANPRKYTVNSGRYLLVEFSDLAIFQSTTEIFERLMTAGMVPVITHPERNPLLQQRLPQLREWADLGCLLQVTGGSLLGRFGRRAREFSEVLLDQELVHFIASDGHDTRHRPPVLDEAREQLRQRHGGALADRLTRDNPRAVIEDLPLPAAPPPEPARRWYQSLLGRA